MRAAFRWLNLTSEMAQPSPVTYASFVSVKNTPKSVHALLESAANFFGDAKVKCDGLLKDGTIAAELFPGVKEYLQGCVKVCARVPLCILHMCDCLSVRRALWPIRFSGFSSPSACPLLCPKIPPTRQCPQLPPCFPLLLFV